jgi:hypothetical protein
MTGPEDKRDRGHNGTGRPGVGEKENWRKLDLQRWPKAIKLRL